MEATMAIRWALAILGLMYLVNGFWTTAEPEAWYSGVPGVSATGPMNMHFIEDVGLAGLASGALLVLAAWKNSGGFAVGGALWPALHSLIHIAAWLRHGLPPNGAVLFTEAVGVVALSAAGIALAWVLARRKGVS
jgi:hypothetical protein